MAVDADPAPGSTEARAPVGGRDLAWAAALCACLLPAYAALAQDTLYGDAEMVLRVFDPLNGSSRLWVHSLLVVVARALRAVGVGGSPFESLRAVSTLAGAVGASAAFLLARGMGAWRGPSLVASLLLACAPAWVFFATTIEIHALHAACFALAACAVVYAPWQRPLLALLLTSLALPLAPLSHQTGPIVGAGLLALVQVGRQRRGLAPFGLRGLCLGIGPVYLAVLLAAFAWNMRLAGVEMRENVAELAFCSAPVSLSTFDELWIAPLGVLLPVAVAALLAGVLTGWRAAALAATVVPAMLFFTGWGVIERGGYALPSAVAMAACGALLVSRHATGRLRPVPWMLVGLHALLALVALQLYHGPRPDDFTRGRSAVVRQALGSPCVLYSVNYRSQFIEFPGAREVNLYPCMLEGLGAGSTPDEFADAVYPPVLAEIEAGASVGLDLSSHDELRIFSPLFASYMGALQERFARELWVTRVDHPLWPLDRLRARPGDMDELTRR